MNQLNYHVICRDCAGYDGQNHISLINELVEQESEITEYKLSITIKNINGEKLACRRCHSLNYEVFNIKLNNIEYFNYGFIKKRCQRENRFLLNFFIGKKEGYPVYQAERDEMPKDVLKNLIYEMKRVIQITPRHFFTDIKTHGNFYFSISCDSKKNFRIEKFSIVGVEYEEVMEELNYYIEDTFEDN